MSAEGALWVKPRRGDRNAARRLLITPGPQVPAGTLKLALRPQLATRPLELALEKLEHRLDDPLEPAGDWTNTARRKKPKTR
jgi:hypothetical protein